MRGPAPTGTAASSNDADNPFGNSGVMTSPKSNNFAREPSGVTVANIAGIGGAFLGLMGIFVIAALLFG